MPVAREVNVRNTKCLRLACRGFIGTKQYRMYGIVIERRSAAYDQATPAELRISVVKPRLYSRKVSLPRVSIARR